ncbi:MAG: hypothetical protein AAFS10_11220 [Myxococcota bacterium]
MDRRTFVSHLFWATAASSASFVSFDALAETSSKPPSRRAPPRRTRRTIRRRRLITRRVIRRPEVGVAPVPLVAALQINVLLNNSQVRGPTYRLVWRRYRGEVVLVVPESIRSGWWIKLDDTLMTVREVYTERIKGRLWDFLEVETEDGLVDSVPIVREDEPDRRADLELIRLDGGRRGRR